MPRMYKNELLWAVRDLRRTYSLFKKTQKLILLSQIPKGFQKTPEWVAERTKLQDQIEALCKDDLSVHLETLGMLLANMGKSGGVFALHSKDSPDQ